MNSLLSQQFPFTLFRKTTRESFVLYFAMFVMGACGLAYEYTLSKVASDILGNSVRQWAIIIGVMMFFMGIGSDLQKHFSNKSLVDKFILFEIAIGLLGAFGPISLLFSYANFSQHYILVQYFFVTSIGLIIGFEIPLITRINETYNKELKVNLGSVLKMDYIGSLVGSLVWIFLLPKYFTIVESAFVLGILNLLVAFFTLVFFRRLVGKFKSITALAVLVFALVLVGLSSAKGWTSYSEQRLFRDKVIFSETTTYQHIVLTKSRAGDIKCFINGQLQFNSFDEHIYHEFLVHPAMAIAPNRERVLVLGGGDGLALREILKYKDVKEVTICDIDPKMTTLAKDDPVFIEMNNNSLNSSKVKILVNNALVDAGSTEINILNEKITHKNNFEFVAKVNIINIDAATFVEQISGLFDVIIIDFPDPNSYDLSKLYSTQFYNNVKQKLSAFGIMVQQSTSPIHAKEAFLCIGRTMQSAGLEVVPLHENVPSFGEWGWWIGGRNSDYEAETIKENVRSISSISVPTKYLTADLIHAGLMFGKTQLETSNTDINDLANNKVYQYYLGAWQR